jgi:hypothetical protein
MPITVTEAGRNLLAKQTALIHDEVDFVCGEVHPHWLLVSRFECEQARLAYRAAYQAERELRFQLE